MQVHVKAQLRTCVAGWHAGGDGISGAGEHLEGHAQDSQAASSQEPALRTLWLDEAFGIACLHLQHVWAPASLACVEKILWRLDILHTLSLKQLRKAGQQQAQRGPVQGEAVRRRSTHLERSYECHLQVLPNLTQ